MKRKIKKHLSLQCGLPLGFHWWTTTFPMVDGWLEVRSRRIFCFGWCLCIEHFNTTTETEDWIKTI